MTFSFSNTRGITEGLQFFNFRSPRMIAYHIAVLSIVTLGASTISPFISLKDSMDHVHRHAYVHPEQFRKSIPVEKLLNEKPHLFLDKDGFDHLNALQVEMDYDTRDAVAQAFVSRNKPDIDSALEEAVRYSNDISLIAAMVNPLEYVTPVMMKPIAKLIEQYRSVRTTPCLMRYLPDIFQSGDWYNRIFEPIKYVAFQPSSVPGVLGTLSHPSMWSAHFEGRLILFRDAHSDVIIDIGLSKAVRLRDPFRNINIIPSLRTLSVIETERMILHVFRNDAYTTDVAVTQSSKVYLDSDRTFMYVEFAGQFGSTTSRFSLEEGTPLQAVTVPGVKFESVKSETSSVRVNEALVIFKDREAARCLELLKQAAINLGPITSILRSLTPYQMTLIDVQRALADGAEGVVEAWRIYQASDLCHLIDSRIEQRNQQGQLAHSMNKWMDIYLPTLTSAVESLSL